LCRFLTTVPAPNSFGLFVRLVLGHLHTVEVVGSNPAVPTIIKNLALE
jgi:hypothetical protein